MWFLVIMTISTIDNGLLDTYKPDKPVLTTFETCMQQAKNLNATLNQDESSSKILTAGCRYQT